VATKYCEKSHATKDHEHEKEHEQNAVARLRGDHLLIGVFLETAASRAANLVLVLEIAMGIGHLLLQDVDVSVLVLWWVALLPGIARYTRWYVPHLFRK